MTTAAVPSRDGSRLHWMDAVRGTAILLLLSWHACAVPQLLGVPIPEPLRAFNAFFMPFRMPTLMLLSGLLLSKSLRKPLPEYYAGKFAMIAWPYVVWVLIAKVVFLDIEGLAWWHWRAWYATSYLWFLFFIGCYYLVAPLLRRLPSWAPVVIAFAAGVVLTQGTTEQRLAYFAVFFFLGNVLSTRPQFVERLIRGPLPLVWAGLGAGLGAASIAWTGELQYATWSAPLSVAGTLALIAAFSRFAGSESRLRALRSTGRASIVYYVAHMPVMMLISRPLLESVGPWTLALLNFVVAVALCAVLARWRQVPPVRWLFESPAPVTKAMTTALRRVLSAVPRPRVGDRPSNG